jgi:hypothetical protein
MKRFTNDGTNGQEGRELIPAQRNAEVEEAPVGLSFEGGEAGARTLSRRQAIGLLGGSLAGASLLSLGLAAPAKADDFAVPFADRDHISLQWWSTPVPFSLSATQNTFLDGRTANATVGLAPNTNPPFTGTRWEAVKVLGTWPPQWWFFCRANWPRPPGAPYYEPGPRWLDGRTQNSTVGLAPSRGAPFTGTKWEVHHWVASGSLTNLVFLKCLGDVPGPRWLRGFPSRGADGTVGLDDENFSLWRVGKLPK